MRINFDTYYLADELSKFIYKSSHSSIEECLDYHLLYLGRAEKLGKGHKDVDFHLSFAKSDLKDFINMNLKVYCNECCSDLFGTKEYFYDIPLEHTISSLKDYNFYIHQIKNARMEFYKIYDFLEKEKESCNELIIKNIL